MDKLKKLLISYESWVGANPETVGDLETTAKWVSYFVAGRISDSNVVSELIYSLSNMLVLYNDRIIYRTRKRTNGENEVQPDTGLCYRLKVILTTLEYSEVFIEISAKRVFGTKGKWVFIALLQLFKAAGRFFILKHSTEQIVTSPALPSLNRRALFHNAAGNSAAATVSQNQTALFIEESALRLKRSGRIIRKIEGAPPLHYRQFDVQSLMKPSQQSKMPISKALLQAEYLYIAKPLIHLAAMGVFGEKRWKQYIIALTLDLASIRLYHKNRHLMNKQQKLEMSKRCIHLLLYLMRSPFYQRYTQSRLDSILGFIADNIPIVRMVAGPIREYVPHWQDTYFYMWSS